MYVQEWEGRMRNYETEHVEVVECDVVMIMKEDGLVEVACDDDERGVEGGGL